MHNIITEMHSILLKLHITLNTSTFYIFIPDNNTLLQVLNPLC